MRRRHWLRSTGGLIVLALALASLPAHAQGTSRTLTLADYGQTIQLHVGDRFLLDLGGDYTWTVRVDDSSVVARVVDPPVNSQAQGVYEAEQPGEALMTAEGRPSCPDPRQACPMLLRGFRVQLVVR